MQFDLNGDPRQADTGWFVLLILILCPERYSSSGLNNGSKYN